MEIKIWFQFCFAIQINLCNLTAIQQDCSEIAEIALWLLRLHSKKKFRNLHIQAFVPGVLREVASCLHSDCRDCSLIVEIAIWLQFCFAIQINLCNLTAIQKDCSLIAEIALWRSSVTYIYSCSFQGYSRRLRDFCTLIVEIAVRLLILQSDCEECNLIDKIEIWNECNGRDFWTEGQCLEFFKSCLLNQWEASILGSQPIGSLYFRSSYFDSPPKIFVIPLISALFRPYWSLIVEIYSCLFPRHSEIVSYTRMIVWVRMPVMKTENIGLE